MRCGPDTVLENRGLIYYQIHYGVEMSYSNRLIAPEEECDGNIQLDVQIAKEKHNNIYRRTGKINGAEK